MDGDGKPVLGQSQSQGAADPPPAASNHCRARHGRGRHRAGQFRRFVRAAPRSKSASAGTAFLARPHLGAGDIARRNPGAAGGRTAAVPVAALARPGGRAIGR